MEKSVKEERPVDHRLFGCWVGELEVALGWIAHGLADCLALERGGPQATPARLSASQIALGPTPLQGGVVRRHGYCVAMVVNSDESNIATGEMTGSFKGMLSP